MKAIHYYCLVGSEDGLIGVVFLSCVVHGAHTKMRLLISGWMDPWCGSWMVFVPPGVVLMGVVGHQVCVLVAPMGCVITVGGLGHVALM